MPAAATGGDDPSLERGSEQLESGHRASPGIPQSCSTTFLGTACETLLKSHSPAEYDRDPQNSGEYRRATLACVKKSLPKTILGTCPPSRATSCNPKASIAFAFSRQSQEDEFKEGKKNGEPEGSPSLATPATSNQRTRTTASERTGCCAARLPDWVHNHRRHPSRPGYSAAGLRGPPHSG